MKQTNAFSVLAPLYDRVNGDQYDRYAALLARIFDRYGRIPTHEVLDIGCGTGGIAERMSANGYDMIGLDRSAEMLSVAQQKLAGKNVLLLQQDMRTMDLYGTVQAAYCSFDGLNYLSSVRDVCQTLARVHLFLEPDGLFVFDVNTQKRLEAYTESTFSYEFDDGLLLWRTEKEARGSGEADEAGGVYRFCLDWFALQEDGLYRRFCEEQTEYAYSAETLQKVAAEQGFRVEAVFGGSEREPVPSQPCGDGDAKTYFVLRRENA